MAYKDKSKQATSLEYSKIKQFTVPFDPVVSTFGHSVDITSGYIIVLSFIEGGEAGYGDSPTVHLPHFIGNQFVLYMTTVVSH